MVGILLISHSEQIVAGVKELAMQMASNAKVVVAGGTDEGRLGTDITKITTAIEEVYSEDGVLIFFDIGSAFMNAELAVEMLDEEKQKHVEIVDAALVEGGVVAIVESAIGKSKAEIKESLVGLTLKKRWEG